MNRVCVADIGSIGLVVGVRVDFVIVAIVDIVVGIRVANIVSTIVGVKIVSALMVGPQVRVMAIIDLEQRMVSWQGEDLFEELIKLLLKLLKLQVLLSLYVLFKWQWDGESL